jgi:hypothetical protein
MQTWKKQFERAKTAEGKRKVVERHARALSKWGGQLAEYEMEVLSEERRAELRTLYAQLAEQLRAESDSMRDAAESERITAPFGRCAFSGQPLPDPGVLSDADAERIYGWSPCQIRYGTWPNGMRAAQ